VIRTLPFYPACPVCGDREVNPAALAVRWVWDEERRCVLGRFCPGAEHTGYAGRVHGGILSALLDECLAWACAVERRSYCMTGEISVRFKVPAKLGEPIELTGRALTSWGTYVRADGEARSAGGELIATASSTFAALSREESLRLHAALRFAPGDLNVLDGGS
jgi:acyl-coenzyme A thioesterase PaaI-like protein